MPFKSNKQLPKGVKGHTPKHAQDTWRKAYNSALKEYGQEDRAAKEKKIMKNHILILMNLVLYSSGNINAFKKWTEKQQKPASAAEVNYPAPGQEPVKASTFSENNTVLKELQKHAEVMIKSEFGFAWQPIVVKLRKAQNPTQDELDTALLAQARLGNIPEILIKAGANINAKDAEGRTPLFYIIASTTSSSSRYNTGTIKKLIELGADTAIKDNEKQNVLEYAISEANKAKSDPVFGLGSKYEPALQELLTTVSPQEIQHIIPGTLSVKPALGKDIAGIIKSKLVQDLVASKLALAQKYLPSVPQEKLRKEIIDSINTVKWHK